uniref:ATP synthase F0 subunit 6 n=1 Tax=Ophiothrix exigua TaxID=1815227 RepID=UPI00286B2A76|nr:ATP synthase F0 subunit 6 [Ophiothrix exigua]WKW95559.1 ATP synthase F0 subunit 6 [Ophiothrix exigua]
MTLIINNIFDQFTPVYISIFSLTLIGAFIGLFWTTFSFNTHLTPTRANIISIATNGVNSSILSSTPSPWSNFILPIFFICLTYNITSLIPYTFSQTSHLSFTFSISIPIWLTLNIMGLINNWKSKVSHLVPQGTPPILIPLMVVIELVSLCIQPLTLGFRLGANILAGHLLIFLCSCVVWTSISASPLGILSFTLLFVLFVLEIAVACIQAAVFTILTNQYLTENNT